MAAAKRVSSTTQLFQRVKDLSMTIVTSSTAERVFGTLPHEAREDTLIVLDADYVNELNPQQHRYFIVCPDPATYSVVFEIMLSKRVVAQPKIKSSYWRNVVAKIERGETYTGAPSVPSVPQEHELVHARPERKIIDAAAQADIVTMIISMFIQRSSLALMNVNNTLRHLRLAAPDLTHDHQLGPTGQPTCLATILTHTKPWSPRAVRCAERLASQEVKRLMGQFRLKYHALVDKCRYDTRINLNREGAMEMVDKTQNRRERKKWMVTQIKEINRFKWDADVMLSEYRAITSHCRNLQIACIAAANDAYHVDIIIVPVNPFPVPLLS